ncbi:MAG: hypothetical protein MK171_03175 [Pirellulales bacterium]|nr:hypothetical protein [Pirellulales bacterium]
MVAPRRMKKVFCTVVRVPVADNTTMSTRQRFSTRPSELVPWADPYIAQLVSKLQREVRSERLRYASTERGASAPHYELEPPCPTADDSKWEWHEQPRWTLNEEV